MSNGESPPNRTTLLLLAPECEEALSQRLSSLFPDALVRRYETSADLPDAGAVAVAKVVTWLDDRRLAELLPRVAERGWSLGLLPHPELRHGRAGFGIASTPEAAAADINGADEAVTVDLFTCNGQAVLNAVVVAGGFALPPESDEETSWRTRLQRTVGLLRNLGSLRLEPMTLTTQKEKRLETAALSVLALQHGRSSMLAAPIVDESAINDGMLNALVLAPRSVGALLRFALSTLLRRSSAVLPPFIGHIRTGALSIEATRPLEYVCDGVAASAQKIELSVAPAALRLFLGRRLSEQCPENDPKELVRAQALPMGEARRELVGYPLPLVAHAGSDEFRDLFQQLRENARASESFLTLMVLATLLAAVGLFANSAPVIIGAMILAPLMSPIVSLAMGLLRQDERLMRRSVRTLVIGVGMAMGCATLLTLLMPLHEINGEIGARLRPTLLDLAVAVISGIAGAYAHARAEVARSLAGVAIAVALVPPLAVAGIGIGWGEWLVFRGAFLLFLTNLAGIVLAAALTFLFLGYSAFHVARRGLLASLLVVVIVSVPLGFGFHRMVEEHRIVRMLQNTRFEQVTVRNVSVLQGRPLLLAVTLVSEQPVTREQVDMLKQSIAMRLDEEVTLQVTQALVY